MRLARESEHAHAKADEGVDEGASERASERASPSAASAMQPVRACLPACLLGWMRRAGLGHPTCTAQRRAGAMTSAHDKAGGRAPQP